MTASCLLPTFGRVVEELDGGENNPSSLIALLRNPSIAYEPPRQTGRMCGPSDDTFLETWEVRGVFQPSESAGGCAVRIMFEMSIVVSANHGNDLRFVSSKMRLVLKIEESCHSSVRIDMRDGEESGTTLVTARHKMGDYTFPLYGYPHPTVRHFPPLALLQYTEDGDPLYKSFAKYRGGMFTARMMLASRLSKRAEKCEFATEHPSLYDVSRWYGVVIERERFFSS